MTYSLTKLLKETADVVIIEDVLMKEVEGVTFYSVIQSPGCVVD